MWFLWEIFKNLSKLLSMQDVTVPGHCLYDQDARAYTYTCGFAHELFSKLPNSNDTCLVLDEDFELLVKRFISQTFMTCNTYTYDDQYLEQ